LERLGYTLEKEALSQTYERFLILADAKKDICDDDLRSLFAESV